MIMSILSDWYDRINGDQYDDYARFLHVCFKNALIDVREVLDVGCGTGGITYALADMGYDMVAVDISYDMLSAAKHHENILYIQGDMRSLDLYGTVQAAYSSYDCLNCMLTADDLDKAFANIALFLEAGGVFVFDLNTPYRAKDEYDGYTYCYEHNDDMLIWRSAVSGRRAAFYLTEFAEHAGMIIRRDDVIYERIWSTRTVLRLLKKHKFDIIGIYGGYDMHPLCDTDAKAYFCCLKSV